jgi:hypothetical protein
MPLSPQTRVLFAPSSAGQWEEATLSEFWDRFSLAQPWRDLIGSALEAGAQVEFEGPAGETWLVMCEGEGE